MVNPMVVTSSSRKTLYQSCVYHLFFSIALEKLIEIVLSMPRKASSKRISSVRDSTAWQAMPVLFPVQDWVFPYAEKNRWIYRQTQTL
jgi:hypothetical protein